MGKETIVVMNFVVAVFFSSIGALVTDQSAGCEVIYWHSGILKLEFIMSKLYLILGGRTSMQEWKVHISGEKVAFLSWNCDAKYMINIEIIFWHGNRSVSRILVLSLVEGAHCILLYITFP